ncbi:hypothetical protein [Planctomycetes bacterium K23_9]|uniref:Uncharacterized protein n=1 Tax=Stieleria marina TaxID=1930275 RepID=A0A517P0S6_9BACT|nr:hypothetical protein K239x_49880 [Planctomycetes bacterium K23_9]
MTLLRCLTACLLLLLLPGFASHGTGDESVRTGDSVSVIELLSGFDQKRIQAAYPPSDSQSFGELAKMVYRMGSVSRDAVVRKAGKAETGRPKTGESENSSAAKIGDAIRIQGTIASIRTLRVPESLVEFLEFPVFQDVLIQLESDASQPVHVIARRLPSAAKAGDRVDAAGVLIEPGDGTDDRLRAIVSTPLKWFPKTPASPGWQLLSDAGVDVSELAQVASRNQLPLAPEDNDAFYQMLSVSQTIGGTPAAAQTDPIWIQPIDLLQKPKDHVGDWVRMRLQTVRVTRVAVTDPKRKDQLGSDHYYQVDANGDLDGIIVRMPRKEDDPREPIEFNGTYPVSLVMKELPSFLTNAIGQQQNGEVVTAMISRPVQIEGFFFRLWSYSTDFMDRRGGGDQVGPLLMVARMTDRASVAQGGIGAEIFGFIAAVAIVGGILATFVWSRFTSSDDHEVREKRKQRESDQVKLPSDLT